MRYEVIKGKRNIRLSHIENASKKNAFQTPRKRQNFDLKFADGLAKTSDSRMSNPARTLGAQFPLAGSNLAAPNPKTPLGPKM
jgi:hypothetical protein